MKRVLLILAVILAFPFQASAIAQLRIEGKVYSSNDREIGIQRGKKVYYIDRKALSSHLQDQLINSKAPVSVEVKLSSLTRVVKVATKQ